MCCEEKHRIEYGPRGVRFLDHPGVPLIALMAESDLIPDSHCGLIVRPLLRKDFTDFTRRITAATISDSTTLLDHVWPDINRRRGERARERRQPSAPNRLYFLRETMNWALIESKVMEKVAISLLVENTYHIRMHPLGGYSQSISGYYGAVELHFRALPWANVWITKRAIVNVPPSWNGDKDRTVVLQRTPLDNGDERVLAVRRHLLYRNNRPIDFALQEATIRQIGDQWHIIDWLA